MTATHARFPIVASGDGYSAYFPVYWALQDGQGLDAFSLLAHGAGRGPGYPLLLFAASLVGRDVARAVTVVAVASALAGVAILYVLVARAAGRTGAVLAVALFVTSGSFLHMSLVSTPDLAAFATAMGAIALALRAPGARRTTAVAAGALAAASFLSRLNLLVLVPLVLAGPLGLARRDRRAWASSAALGALVPLAAWSAVSGAARGSVFWIPAGPTEVSAPTFHERLGVHGGLAELLAADPLILGARLAERLVAGAAVDVGWHAAGPLCVLAALASLPALVRARPRELGYLGAAALVGWVAIAPLHAEPRYYPVQVAWLCALAGLGFERLVQRARRVHPVFEDRRAARLLVAGALAIVFGTSVERIRSASSSQEGGAQIIAEVEALAEPASRLTGACVGAEEVGFRLTPLRWSLRRRGGPDLCCCGPRSGDAGFFRVTAHAHTSREALAPDYELVKTSTALGGLELYRARASRSARAE